MPSKVIQGAGLGFRRELIGELKSGIPEAIEFFEIAPENWAGMGGQSARDLRQFTEQRPFVCHGLSLSLGGPSPLDEALLLQIRRFMAEHNISLYTEHLAWCADSHHLYELLPIPLTEKALIWTVDRISRTQDLLGQRIGVENASYYFMPPGADMSEAEFIGEVIRRTDCGLHLDVNNIYVNSQNFGFDPHAFLHSLPLDRTCYVHVAGHYTETDGLIIDTHGAAVIDPVWSLLTDAYASIGHAVPTCLERDFNLPDLTTLTAEVRHIAHLQAGAAGRVRKAA